MVVGLAVLVLVHEGGHLLVARAVGVRVDEVALGFGPALVSFRPCTGDGCRAASRDSDRAGAPATLYSLRLLPLGGYVSLAGLGEERPARARVRDLDPEDYRAQGPGRKALIIAGGPAANVALAVLLGAAAAIAVALGGRAGADPSLGASGTAAEGGAVGPLGILETVWAVAGAGPVPFVVLMAFISVQVGLLNLLPVPPLDGGQLLVIAVEKLRGRPLEQRTQRRLALWGVALIGAAFAAVLYDELVRLLGALLERPPG